MLVIASNITTRSRRVADALRPGGARKRPQRECAEVLSTLARQCVAAGAGVLDRETMRTARLMNIFADEIIYSDSEMER